jgi:hypothetical protein
MTEAEKLTQAQLYAMVERQQAEVANAQTEYERLKKLADNAQDKARQAYNRLDGHKQQLENFTDRLLRVLGRIP